MGLTRTAWHVLLAALFAQRGSTRYARFSEVALSAEPLRVDFVFRRQNTGSDDSATTLKKLWGLLPQETLLEFKSVGRPYRSTNIDKFVAYLHVYYVDAAAALKERSNLGGVLLVPLRSKALDTDVKALGLTWEDLGDGYWSLVGGPFTLFAVELDVVARAEDDDVLGLFGHYAVQGVETRRWLAEQLGAEEIAMHVSELEGYDEVVLKLVATLPPEQVLAAFAPEKRLAGLAPEQRLAGLAPEQRLAGLAPEQRLAGLAPEQILLTLPDNVLRSLSVDYLDTLSEATRAVIRSRIGR